MSAQHHGRGGVGNAVVDIHSHILPQVDDGPKSWDVSVAICKLAVVDGITHMVATPHANDRYAYDREFLKGEIAHLQGLVGDSLKLGLGCDFHLSYDNIRTRSPIPSATSSTARVTCWSNSAITACRNTPPIPCSSWAIAASPSSSRIRNATRFCGKIFCALWSGPSKVAWSR